MRPRFSRNRQAKSSIFPNFFQVTISRQSPPLLFHYLSQGTLPMGEGLLFSWSPIKTEFDQMILPPNGECSMVLHINSPQLHMHGSHRSSDVTFLSNGLNSKYRDSGDLLHYILLIKLPLEGKTKKECLEAH